MQGVAGVGVMDAVVNSEPCSAPVAVWPNVAIVLLIKQCEVSRGVWLPCDGCMCSGTHSHENSKHAVTS